MNIKLTVTALALLSCLQSFAQVKVTKGNTSPQFVASKQPKFAGFAGQTGNYFVITRTERYEKTHTLIVTDEAGNITSAKDVKLNMGVLNNNFDGKEILVIENTPYMFVENHVKDGGLNTFSVRKIDNNGTIAPTGQAIGTINFTKMSNPGDWYVSLSPDKKHVAVIGISPYEKNTAQQIQYFLLDQNLKETAKGQFTFAGNTKQIGVYNFLTSNNGDLYIIGEDYDKAFKLPVVYAYKQGGQPAIIPVMAADPDIKNFSYTSSINADGNLIIAGYTQTKKTFSAGDPQTTGTYLFNSAKPNEVKIFPFEKPVTNLTARNIVYNGDTFFLIGEQYKADKEKFTGSALSPMALVDVFDYTHQNIMVTAYSNDFAKKFEIPISRKFTGHEFDQDLMVASGIINNKLALVYNDEYGKYYEDKFRRYNKLPVAVLITNDGLMESPVNFANELDVKVSTYTLYPQFFSNANGKMVILSGNAQSVTTNIFK